jgi:hypothetical protein
LRFLSLICVVLLRTSTGRRIAGAFCVELSIPGCIARSKAASQRESVCCESFRSRDSFRALTRKNMGVLWSSPRR